MSRGKRNLKGDGNLLIFLVFLKIYVIGIKYMISFVGFL